MKKIFSLFAVALFSVTTIFAASGVDWSAIAWLGNGSGDAVNTDKYKVSEAEGLSVVNIQQPPWSDEAGIYVNVPAGITACTVNGKIDGAGMILYLTSFTAQETQVTITYGADLKCTFWVYYADGTTESGEGGEEPEPTPDPETPQPEGTNIFDPAQASIESTYLAPGWNLDPNSSATYDPATGTIAVNLKSTFVERWQAQVKFKHNVAFNADKHYVFSAKFHSNVAVNGVLVKMDDQGIVLEDGTITLPADEDFVYTSTPKYGVAGNNQIMVFDFGYATPCQITITDISIKEITPVVEEVEHPAAAPAPTLPAEQVFSIYSDTYTTTVTRVTGSWNQTTKEEEVQLAEGDKAFYYTTCNHLGWEFNGSTTIGDMTAYPKLHMDIYVAEAGAVEFTPIWGSEALKKYTLQAGWNAIDIELATDFVGINLANIYQLKWANMPEICYIDNVYFYKSNATAVDNVAVDTRAIKVIENGQLFLIRDGKLFNALGQSINQ